MYHRSDRGRKDTRIVSDGTSSLPYAFACHGLLCLHVPSKHTDRGRIASGSRDRSSTLARPLWLSSFNLNGFHFCLGGLRKSLHRKRSCAGQNSEETLILVHCPQIPSELTSEFFLRSLQDAKGLRTRSYTWHGLRLLRVTIHPGIEIFNEGISPFQDLLGMLHLYLCHTCLNACLYGPHLAPSYTNSLVLSVPFCASLVRLSLIPWAKLTSLQLNELTSIT